MFTSKNDQEALTAAMDEYARDHMPVSCDDLMRAMEEQGFHCYPNMCRQYLKSRGLQVRNVSRRWLWGHWDEQDENTQIECSAPKDVGTSKSTDALDAQNRNETNDRMAKERDALLDAVRKSVELRKEIKSAQERLLVEIADLIHSTYAQTPVASKREPETKSEAD